MKKLLLIFLTALTYANCSLAQTPLTADAGPDVVICGDAGIGIGPHFIGGQPSATGGVPPYTYSWSFTYKLPGLPDTSYASDFFNDTTLANPTVVWMEISNNPNIPEFVLTVRDANGNIAQDSVSILMSSFIYHMLNYYYTIQQGDSVEINVGPDVFGGLGPMNYVWNPSHGLSDTTLSNNFYAKPDTNIEYYVTVSDSVGCSQQGKSDYLIFAVWPVGIDDGLPNKNIKVYPNPATEYITIERQNVIEEEQFTLYDILGKQVFIKNLHSGNETIDVSNLARGNYTFIVGSATGNIVLR